MRASGRSSIDMTNGPLLGKIIQFSVPLMLTSILQLMFNTADTVVLGRFAGKDALASVGSTNSLINLIVCVLIGMTVGTNVVVARAIGAGDEERISKAVHTSVAVSLFGGVIIGLLGILVSGPMLRLMGTTEEALEGAKLYMKIYFAGYPGLAVYNFGAAILRAVGDTKKPLYFLTLSGIINVLLNLLCVIVLKMGVAGVAIPTVLSQLVATTLVVICLMRHPSKIRVNWRKIRIDGKTMLSIMKIGLPAGIQSSVFSVSNVVVQSAVNSFNSTTVVAANSAAFSLDQFANVSQSAVYQASLTFTSQNIGAKKYDRVKKILITCSIVVTIICLTLDSAIYLAGRPLLGIYSTDPDVIEYGLKRLLIVGMPYFICGLMDVLVGMMRGMGRSWLPMIVSMTGVCGVRLTWVYTVFAKYHKLEILYLAYPLSWAVTGLVQLACFIVCYRRLVKKWEHEPRL